MSDYMNRRSAEKIGLKRGKMLSGAIDQNLRNFWASANNKGISKHEVLEEVDNNSQRLSKLTRMEIKGMSRAAKVPYADLLAFNLFEENISPDGCTVAISAGDASASGETIFFKQSDKKGSSEFAGENCYENQQVNVVRVEEHEGGKSVIMVAAAGSTAVKMGINNKGVAIGSNISRTITFDEEGKSAKEWAAASRGEFMRQGLIQGDTAVEAAQVIAPLLLSDPMSSPGSIDISDARRTIILEGEFTSMAAEWIENGVIGRANKFEILSHLARSRSEIPSSYCRYERVMEVLEANKGNVTVETMRDLSIDVKNGPGLNSICRYQENDYNDETTLSAAIFQLKEENPGKSEVYIALGKTSYSWRSEEGEGWIKISADAKEKDIPESFLTGDAWLKYYTEEPYNGNQVPTPLI
tara:strand:+ start:1318 stop:2553 length:1236 start_codon:yes stop_codon:yes gene_type:complete